MGKRIIISDLDGTLSDYGHRVKHWKSGDYETFNSLGMQDTPIQNVCNILRGLRDDETEIVIMTARDDSYYNDTAKWLVLNEVPFDKLIMRPKGDKSSDDDCKRKLLEKHIDYQEVWFVLEDRDSVVNMWRGEGLTCLQVASGGY